MYNFIWRESTSRQPESSRFLGWDIHWGKCIKSKCIKCRHRNANPIHPPMFSHSPILELITSDPLKWSSKDLPWKNCAASSLVSQQEHTQKIAQSLGTTSCLAAVTRFIARCGYPSTIIIDNGTHSVGAAHELKALVEARDKAKIESDLARFLLGRE